MHPGTENGWHTDVTWMEKPSLGSVAQCTLAPPIGGDTLFADSHAAFLGLPTTLQDRLMELSGIHDYSVFLNRGGVAMPDDLIKDLKAQIPFGVAHPIARTHPETHKLALYLHGGFCAMTVCLTIIPRNRSPHQRVSESPKCYSSSTVAQNISAAFNGPRVQ